MEDSDTVCICTFCVLVQQKSQFICIFGRVSSSSIHWFIFRNTVTFFYVIICIYSQR